MLPVLILVGAIASHGDFPIERIKLDRNGKFLGSVSHDDCLKLTDVSEILEDSDDEDGDEDVAAEDNDDAKSVDTVKGKSRADADMHDDSEDEGDSDDSEDDDEVDEHGDTAMDTSDDEEEDRAERKKQKRKEKLKQKKADRRAGLVKPKEQTEANQADKGFFDDL
jgi:hypothetical protein